MLLEKAVTSSEASCSCNDMRSRCRDSVVAMVLDLIY